MVKIPGLAETEWAVNCYQVAIKRPETQLSKSKGRVM